MRQFSSHPHFHRIIGLAKELIHPCRQKLCACCQWFAVNPEIVFSQAVAVAMANQKFHRHETDKPVPIEVMAEAFQKRTRISERFRFINLSTTPIKTPLEEPPRESFLQYIKPKLPSV